MGAPTTIVVQFHAAPGKTRELRHMIQSAMPRLADLPGCLGGSLHYDMGDPDTFVIIEHWESAQAHKDYVQRLEEDGTMDRMRPLLTSDPDRRYLGPEG